MDILNKLKKYKFIIIVLFILLSVGYIFGQDKRIISIDNQIDFPRDI
jgi:hypothetical protein